MNFNTFNSLEETREELEEFQISSRELECELEAQLEQLESKNKDLLSETSKLGSENSSLKVRNLDIFLLFFNKNRIKLNIYYNQTEKGNTWYVLIITFVTFRIQFMFTLIRKKLSSYKLTVTDKYPN